MKDAKKGAGVRNFVSLNEILDEQGIREEVEYLATKKIVSLQLQAAMKEQNLSKSAVAAKMGTSRAQLDRVLDPHAFNVTMETMSKAAAALGRRIHFRIE
jgi:antitoxin HicB